MKCTNCGSANIETGILFGTQNGPRYYVNENGRAKEYTAKVYCDLCMDCGTILRIYIKEDGMKNWVREAGVLKAGKKFFDESEEAKKKTLDYYNQKSEVFAKDTKDIEFSGIQDHFLQYLEPGSLILDLGCGSGRDSRYFLEKGYRVEACDGSEEMVKIASKTAGIPVRKMLFEELDEEDRYDGIFACASILHVCFSQLPDILGRIRKALRQGGTAYVSFKYGTFEGYRSGRYFTDLNEERFSRLMEECEGLEVIEQAVTSDARPGREQEKWLNVFLRKTA